MAVRCDSAASGADLSSGLLASESARYAYKRGFFSKNCDAAGSLKAKTSRLNIAHLGNILI
jgi:hypothetical protein